MQLCGRCFSQSRYWKEHSAGCAGASYQSCSVQRLRKGRNYFAVAAVSRIDFGDHLIDIDDAPLQAVEQEMERLFTPEMQRVAPETKEERNFFYKTLGWHDEASHEDEEPLFQMARVPESNGPEKVFMTRVQEILGESISGVNANVDIVYRTAVNGGLKAFVRLQTADATKDYANFGAQLCLFMFRRVMVRSDDHEIYSFVGFYHPIQ